MSKHKNQSKFQNSTAFLIIGCHCTEVRFASFLSGAFITATGNETDKPLCIDLNPN